MCFGGGGQQQGGTPVDMGIGSQSGTGVAPSPAPPTPVPLPQARPSDAPQAATKGPQPASKPEPQTLKGGTTVDASTMLKPADATTPSKLGAYLTAQADAQEKINTGRPTAGGKIEVWDSPGKTVLDVPKRKRDQTLVDN